MKRTLPVILLLSVFFLIVLTSAETKSPICDEVSHHIGTGYSYIRTHDFRLTPSPPLIRLLIGLPLIFLDPKLPTDHISWEEVNSSDFNYQFLFVYNNNAEKIVFFSRFPMILLATILGFLIFVWAKKIYGYKAGLFALFLYVFSPTILGNAPLAMLDMGCAAFVFLAVFQFYRYIEDQTVPNLLLSGILFGLAQATKITALILYPLFLVFIIARYFLNKKEGKSVSFAGMLKNIIYIWIIGIFVLWGTYFFEFKPLLKNEPDVQEKIEYIKKFSRALPIVKNKEEISEALIKFANNVPIPLSTYGISIMGFGRQVILGGQGLFFMGHDLDAGSKIYYAVLFLIRTPLPFLIFIASNIILFRKARNTRLLDDIFLLTPVITVFLMASFSRLQGGIRYLLPLYPFLFVWVSRSVTIETERGYRAVKGLFYCLCIWYLLSAALAYPHYLAYFNELVGGPDGIGYRITADADWGQDLKSLKKYMDKHNIEKIKFFCFGSADPSYYGIRYEKFTKDDFEKPVKGRYYAISSRLLRDVKWADEYVPIGRAAHTIFIYHVKDEKS